MQERIYIDNASTSFPKAEGVAAAMAGFLGETGANINRGVYSAAFDAADTVLETREMLQDMLGAPSPKNIIFTANVTSSLNMLIKGLFSPGGHVIVTPFEHNATMRPLTQMVKNGGHFSRIRLTSEGKLDLKAVEEEICGKTTAIFAMHASNVSGEIFPIAALGEIAKKHGLFFIVDAAQTAGVLDVNMRSLNADAVAFTGHKGLLGPQGIGGFALTDPLAARLEPLISGGTGSFSDSEEVPNALPDKFEAGTMNIPGIYGLNAALKFLQKTGIDAVHARENALRLALESGLRALPGAGVLGREGEDRTAVVSVDFVGRDNAEIAFRLDDEYGIMTRCGLHCAPNAHKMYGTFPQGTVRFSPGFWNKPEEIDLCVGALKEILR